MEQMNDDHLVQLEFHIVPNNCGHFGIAVELQVCFTEEEAIRAASLMQQLLVHYMPAILGGAALVSAEPRGYVNPKSLN